MKDQTKRPDEGPAVATLRGAERLALVQKYRDATAFAVHRTATLNALPPSPRHLRDSESAVAIAEDGSKLLRVIEANAADGDPDDVKAMLDCLVEMGRWAVAVSRHEQAVS